METGAIDTEQSSSSSSAAPVSSEPTLLAFCTKRVETMLRAAEEVMVELEMPTEECPETVRKAAENFDDALRQLTKKLHEGIELLTDNKEFRLSSYIERLHLENAAETQQALDRMRASSTQQGEG
mmetsp:Transcript_17711/g.35973  ORF Transcript_17711/g.35973 Transcript_17711/m.35973 type:complete len:125 (-) Transcript_17711:338-712(-)